MSELEKAQQMMAAAVAAKSTEDPEITSVRRVLKLLDKTAKSNRTYGSTNPVALKFSQQLFEELSTHLSQHSKLTFLVQRSALTCKDQVVYQPENDGGSESLAFKLYGDGIRELVLHQGLTQEDLGFFLDSLWGGVDPTNDDDDIVTRLWSKNLPALTIVTAEEVAKASGSGEGFLLLDQGRTSSDSTLRELLDRELARGKKQAGTKQTAEAGPSAQGGQAHIRFKSNLIGYEVTDEELAVLAKEISAENQRDSTLYILDMATAILASERSPALLTKLFGLWDNVVDALVREGKWTVLESVLSLLHETEEVRPDLHEDHKRQLASLFDQLGRPERLKAIELYLNRTRDANTEGLSTILFLLKADALPGLCSLLAALEFPAHQAIVCDALVSLAKHHPEPLLKGLSDRRPTYVKNLLSILVKWNDPRHVEAIEKLVRYPDGQVRKEVIRAMSVFRPNGNGAKLIAFVTDVDESVRLAALKVLTSGQYTVSFSAWSPLVSSDEFMERALSEKRAVYQAVRATCGDEAIVHWEQLLTEWHWTNRKKKEELAVLAAETLGKLATPKAVVTLELGQKKGGTAVRHACAMALAHIRRHSGKPPMAAAS
ncbi:MAG TPA: HEAT repeat domain-containing protein [Nitrospira sp.]|nr:HEAT repeat domain-containing protein [Nitrospira sp.]